MGSVERSLDVLEMIVEAETAPTHTELATALAIPKSTLSQILGVLQHTGYLGIHNRRYLPGVRLLSLVHRAAIAAGMPSAMRSWMDELAAESGETVSLGILAGTHVTCVDQSPSPRAIRYVTPIGQPRPLHATALGRVLLAFGGGSAKSLIPLIPYTDKTITDPDKLDKMLVRIRRDGYALNEGESVEGVIAIAAPLFNARHDLIAALSVAGPSNRLGDATERVWPLLRRTVNKMEKSGVLG